MQGGSKFLTFSPIDASKVTASRKATTWFACARTAGFVHHTGWELRTRSEDAPPLGRPWEYLHRGIGVLSRRYGTLER